MPPLEEGDARSEVSEWELRERREREEEREAEAEELGAAGELGAGGAAAVPAHALLHGTSRRVVGDGLRFFGYFLCYVLGAHLPSGDRPGRRANGSLQRAATARTADRRTGKNVRRHDLYWSNASMIKQKKKLQCSPIYLFSHLKSARCRRTLRTRGKQ